MKEMNKMKMKAIHASDYGSISNLQMVQVDSPLELVEEEEEAELLEDEEEPKETKSKKQDGNNKDKTKPRRPRPRPQLKSQFQLPKGKILIKTHAVALAPGDVRVLSGKTKELQGPPSMPYIPGGDCSGTVVDMGNVGNESESASPSPSPSVDDLGYDLGYDLGLGYGIGDRVAARFADGPRGAICEYAIISTAMCDVIPDEVSFTEAAALASSATVALSLSKKVIDGSVTSGSATTGTGGTRIPAEKLRVLILGAGGGVGSHLCQLLRLRDVGYIAGVSKNPHRLLNDLGCDAAIDYTSTDSTTRQQDPLTIQEWVAKPFDVIVDLASGGSWTKLMTMINNGEGVVIKSAAEGGRFLTISGDEPWYELHGIWPALKKFLFVPLYRAFYSRAFWNKSKMPKYSFAFSLENDREIMRETMKLASEGDLKACIDGRGPFPFTTQGVRDAFELQESRHVEGKVVIDFSLDQDEKI